MKLKYFSHSSFQITTDSGQVLLIDPFLDDNPTSPVKSDQVRADFVRVRDNDAWCAVVQKWYQRDQPGVYPLNPGRPKPPARDTEL